MIYNINGTHFYNLLDYGIRNLAVYKDKVNMLNVFPVPDGDTGTNMLLTLQNGLAAIKDTKLSLGKMAQSFARAIVFGARGNSGVILSQFFRGMSESFYDLETADFCEFASALEHGVDSAYKSVANPVEGTILTVIREAIEYIRYELDNYRLDSINDIINAFLEKARITLDNTPKMLAVLKNANVVDSGGAGIIYVFEGMKCYLEGKSLPIVDNGPRLAESTGDYSAFNKNSVFEYGYCTELLIQLTFRADSFSLSDFREELSRLGDSIVLSQESDKVKLHIHTKSPEKILAHCHTYGEFLAVKIENMSVQHQETLNSNLKVSQNEASAVSVVAVAHSAKMEQSFFEMGADVVLSGGYAYIPTASDFVNAFKLTKGKSIIVFPNDKNTCLTASQAASLCRDTEIHIVNTKTDSECYAVLPLVDYESEQCGEVADVLNEAVGTIDTVLVTRATKNANISDHSVKEGDFVAMLCDKSILVCGNSLAYVVGAALKQAFSKCDREIVTVFANQSVPENIKDAIVAYVNNHSPLTEVEINDTDDSFYNVILTLE